MVKDDGYEGFTVFPCCGPGRHGKWKPLILHYLQYGGVKRYNEILRYLGTAPKKTLTAQLRELEEDGIIDRTVIPTLPVQVEYSITEQGKTLIPIIEQIEKWGDNFRPQMAEILKLQEEK